VGKAFTPSEVVDIDDALIPIEKAKAAARQAEHGKTAPGRKKHLGEIPPSVKGRAADHVARVVGKDRKTIAKARVVVNAAKANPEKFGKLKEDMDRTGRVNGVERSGLSRGRSLQMGAGYRRARLSALAGGGAHGFLRH
jgi:hypothetical protein